MRAYFLRPMMVCLAASCGAHPVSQPSANQTVERGRNPDEEGSFDSDAQQSGIDLVVGEDPNVGKSQVREEFVKIHWDAPPVIPIDTCQSVSAQLKNLDGTPFSVPDNSDFVVRPQSYFVMYQTIENCETENHSYRIISATLSAGSSEYTLYVKNYVPETVTLSATLWVEEFDYPEAKVTIDFQ